MKVLKSVRMGQRRRLADQDFMWNQKVDVYSFGVLLFEVWTCHPPYEDLEALTVVSGVIRGTLRPTFASEREREDCLWLDIMERCWASDSSEVDGHDINYRSARVADSSGKGKLFLNASGLPSFS